MLPILENTLDSGISFGTGGIRGIMGKEAHQINSYTIEKATRALALYLNQQFFLTQVSVVIGFDSRHHSKEFAKLAAEVLSHYGITVFLLNDLRPTPYISFAVRHLKANAAIMITASHNSKEYNGYKVYWQDGAQIVAPHDQEIIQILKKLPSSPLTVQNNLIHFVDDSLDASYLKAITPLQLFPEENKLSGKDLQIVYTSLHGTGISLAPKALRDWGFSQLTFVESQIIPDGDFPTVTIPNPEHLKALELGIDLLQTSHSDILLATDPDADRLGVVVRHKGAPAVLTGNEIAVLCTEYLCKVLTLKNTLPTNPAFITTVVSSNLIKTICTFYKVSCFTVLTGFKYIGEKIHEWDLDQSHTFIFGAEESYGYLLGTHSRDKDAIVSCCLLSEMALYFKKQNKTLVDFLEEIYQTYGIFKEDQISIEFSPGKDGMDSTQKIMNQLRRAPPTAIFTKQVLAVEDYLQGIHGLPSSDMISLRLEGSIELLIRPSGTEPKIKIYGKIQTPYKDHLEKEMNAVKKELQDLLKHFKSTLIL